MASEVAQGNLARSLYPKFDTLSEIADDGDEWDFVIGGESAHGVDVERRLRNLQNGCRTMKKKVPINVEEAAELAQKVFCSSDTPVDMVSPSELLDPTIVNFAVLSAKLDMSKAHIAEIKFM